MQFITSVFLALVPVSLLPGSTGGGAPVSRPVHSPLAEIKFLGFFHLVREGDTWETISEMYQVDGEELRHLNRFPENFPLLPGTSLKVPAEKP